MDELLNLLLKVEAVFSVIVVILMELVELGLVLSLDANLVNEGLVAPHSSCFEEHLHSRYVEWVKSSLGRDGPT